MVDPVRISEESAQPHVELIELPSDAAEVDVDVDVEETVEDEWAWVNDIPAVPHETFPELVTYWGIYLPAYAAVRLVNDTIGPRRGRAVTLAGMAVTTLIAHSLFGAWRWPALHHLIASFGDWPVAALGTLGVWSLLGLPAGVIYGLRALRDDTPAHTSA
jgi:hypothetical protein